MFTGDSDEADDGAEITESASIVDRFEGYSLGKQIEVASKDTVIGTGEVAKPGDVLSIAYKGQVMKTGKVFDEGTFAFKLGDRKVIPGWEIGVEGMKVDGKRILKIPPNLAYGARGAGDGVIPPNADLQFDCELKALGNGPGAEAKIKLDNILSKLYSPRGVALALLLAASVVTPKDAKIGDLFGGFISNLANN